MCELRLEIFTVRGNMLNNLIMLVEKRESSIRTHVRVPLSYAPNKRAVNSLARHFIYGS